MSDSEPFFDYNLIDQEAADALRQAMLQAIETRKALVEEGSIANAVEVMKAGDTLEEVVHAVKSDCYRIPATVHIAGEKKVEQNPDDPTQEGVIQRCARCGSVLNFWHEHMPAMTMEGVKELEEEDVPWWQEGDIIGKHTGPGLQIGVYQIDSDRALESHERECVDISSLEGDFS